jgi:hypothetical protein
MIRVNSMPFSAKREPKIRADYRSFTVLVRSHGIMKNFRHIKYGPGNFHCNEPNTETFTFLVSPNLY